MYAERVDARRKKMIYFVLVLLLLWWLDQQDMFVVTFIYIFRSHTLTLSRSVSLCVWIVKVCDINAHVHKHMVNFSCYCCCYSSSFSFLFVLFALWDANKFKQTIIYTQTHTPTAHTWTSRNTIKNNKNTKWFCSVLIWMNYRFHLLVRNVVIYLRSTTICSISYLLSNYGMPKRWHKWNWRIILGMYWEYRGFGEWPKAIFHNRYPSIHSIESNKWIFRIRQSTSTLTANIEKHFAFMCSRSGQTMYVIDVTSVYRLNRNKVFKKM